MDKNSMSSNHCSDVVQAKLERKVRENRSIKAGEEELYVQLLYLWKEVISDLFILHCIPPLPGEVWSRWMHKIASTSIRTVSRDYGIALDILRRSENYDAFVDTFKGYIARERAQEDFLPVLHYIKCALGSAPLLTHWFAVVTQVVSFPFRANLDAPPLEEAWSDYVRVDGECAEVPSPVLCELANAYSYLIDNEKTSSIPFAPRHGPGAIMEWTGFTGTKDLRSKYALARVPQIVAYAVSRYDGARREYGFPVSSLRSPCKFSPVPKSIGKTRTICIEPAGMQFSQQGLRGVLEDVISQSRLSSHVNFKDLSKATGMARIGSIDGSYSTIDLSNASDRIPYSLMRGVFRDSRLLPLLVACRTPVVKYQSKSLRLRKLHTSGSAACFPTETIIFSTMCQAAIWRTRKADPRSRTKFDFAVYGDDIVISTPCVPALLDILRTCGSVVNESKSFVGSSFTECCGFEFFKGVDVTPLRIPREFNLWGLLNGAWYGDDVESFNQCIDFANKCKEFGLFNLRRRIIRSVFDRERAYNNPAFGLSGLKTEWVVNDHLPVSPETTRDYQATYRLCKRVVAAHYSESSFGIPCTNGDVLNEDQSLDLMHWFVCSDLRPDDILSYGKAVLERRAKTFALSIFPDYRS